MSDTNEAKIKEIIVEQLSVTADQVTREAKMIEDLGADSLDAVELVMAIEEEFGIEVAGRRGREAGLGGRHHRLRR